MKFYRFDIVFPFNHNYLSQIPLEEHGGKSQRSDLPQQVVPFLLEFPILMLAGAVNCFSTFTAPHFGHIGSSDFFIIRKSKVSPHF